MTARYRRTWPVPPLLLLLESFTPKPFPKHREEKQPCALLMELSHFPRFLVLTLRDEVGSHDATQGKILLEDVSALSYIRHFLSSWKLGRNWWLMLPFPRPPRPGLITGVTSNLLPCPTHWRSSLFTILSCLLPAGATRKPEGGFLGLLARRGT